MQLVLTVYSKCTDVASNIDNKSSIVSSGNRLYN